MDTTLNKIRAGNPCVDRWVKLLKYLGKTKADDEPLSFRTIYESNGADDCLWCACTLEKKDRVYLGAKFAETSLEYTKDDCLHQYIKTCFDYVDDRATEDELYAAVDGVVLACELDADAMSKKLEECAIIMLDYVEGEP